MGVKSATFVVALLQDGMEHKTVQQNAAEMIFWNRMIRGVNVAKLPEPQDHVTLRDIRRLSGCMSLEVKGLPKRAADEQFCHYIIGRFERIALKRRW